MFDDFVNLSNDMNYKGSLFANLENDSKSSVKIMCLAEFWSKLP